MSRYFVDTHDYGYDRPLSEYFFDEEVGPLGDKPGTASNLREALIAHELWDQIPEEHRVAIAMDRPF